MNYEWDEIKASINIKNHGISFDEAKTVWMDALAKEFYDEGHSENEDRYIRIGWSLKNRILLVVYCEREEKAQ